MLRHLLLWASRQRRVERMLTTAPPSKALVDRFVAGDGLEDAVRVTRELVGQGLLVTLDHLGEDTVEPSQAAAVAAAYQQLLARLADDGLTRGAEVSVKLSALGLSFDPALAVGHARSICGAAAAAGTTVTIDMEDHTTTDATLASVATLREGFPWTGAVIQAALRRSEADCERLAAAGSRVRLCKGAYDEPERVAYRSHRQVDRSYQRCLSHLMAGAGYPMVATHDPHLIAFAEQVVQSSGRAPTSYEFQMLYGGRPAEQRRLAADGHQVRVYVPYGDEWYAYLMRRLAERPANVSFFLRAATSRR